MSEDNSWVFDSLVCFLHGPVWNAPLQTFIEEKSLIFDPNQEVNEENEEYRKIHEDYKNLVDFMLGSFMEEMHISPEQFEMACLEGRNQQAESTFTFHQGLFQQIWAANDIRIFIRMMTQRNVELQLQALDLLEQRQNSENSVDTSVQYQEDSTGVNNDSDTERAISESLIAAELSTSENPETETIGKEKFERLSLFFDNKKIDSAEVQARQEYLRTQRDKIVEIKKKARAKQLTESSLKNISGSSGTRPTSAQVAKQILEGNADEVVQNPEKNEASVQLRKALAKRLRIEVVEQK